MKRIVHLTGCSSLLIALAVVALAHAMTASLWAIGQGSPGEGTRNAILTKKVPVGWETAGLPLSFAANQGQTDSAVKFISRGDGYALFLTAEEAVFKLGLVNVLKKAAPAEKQPSVLRMKLLGADGTVKISGAEPLPGIENYFIGNDPKQWHTGVATYRKVKYQGLYPGVDAVFYGNQRELEYDFTVAPGVDPKRIELEFYGARPKVTRDGDIVLKLNGDSVTLRKPIVYQGTGPSRRTVDGRYAVARNRVRFQIGKYDRSQPLVIDPAIIYMTYLGGSTGINGNPAVTSISCRPNACPPGYSYQRGQGIAVDSSGNVYVTGQTWASDFPTQNPFQATSRSLTNQWTAYVTKLNPTGTGLVYSTYLGGSVNDEADAIAVDANGSAYVVGLTFSGDFPTTPGSYMPQCPVQAPGPPVLTFCQSSSGSFLTKLSPDGRSLAYSTYLVTPTSSIPIRAVAVDAQGRAYVTGDYSAYCSMSGTNCLFPTTANAVIPSSLFNQSLYQHTSNPGMAYLTVFSADGSSLVYSTLFGDTDPTAHGNYGNQTLNYTRAVGVTVDPNGNFYIAGITADPNIPVTANAFQTTYVAFTTADRSYVAKFSPVTSANGPQLIYCTYLGAMNTNLNASDEIYGIVADASGSAIVTGLTQNPGFPTTPGTYNPGPCGVLNNGNCGHGAFVTKFTPDGTGLAWSTLVSYAYPVSGTGYNGIQVILPPRLDNLGNVYVAVKSSLGYPVVNPVQTFTDYSDKVGITKLDPSGSMAIFSTLLGGTTGQTQYGASNQFPGGLDVDRVGNIYVGGMTSGGDLPTTPGAFQTTFPLTSNNNTGFIAKVHPFNANPFEVPVSAGGAAASSTDGSGASTRAGYAAAGMNSGDTPYGTAIFSFRQNGVTVSEAGVPASPPTTSARIFIDYRSGVIAIPGRSGSGIININTGIAVANYAYVTANVTYTLRDLSGATLAIGHGTIAARSHFACFIDQLKATAAPDFNLPSNFQFGTLEMGSDQPLSVLALRGTNNQRNDFLITTTPVADLTQAVSSDPAYFPQFADGSGYTTSLVLLNTTGAAESGTLQILDNNGNPLSVAPVGGTAGSSFRYSIPARGAFHFQTDGSPTNLNVGWVRLIPDSSNSTPIGSGVFSYNPGPILISESGIPAAGSTTHARVYVDLSGDHNTGLAIANIGNAAASVTIHAYQNDGVTAAGTSQGPLQLVAYGHAAKFADQFITGLPSGFTGVIDISSTTPFAALTIRGLVNERNDFLMTTFPIADANAPAPSPIVFPQVATGGGYITEFIFISAGLPASTTLYYYSDAGNPTDF